MKRGAMTSAPLAQRDSPAARSRAAPAGPAQQAGAAGTWRAPAALRRALHRWYRANLRDLPWRRTRDPYRILVSEFMLQQTRVETVIPYYGRFLDEFPTLHDLAAAPLERVLTLWSGLGYYRRARHLHAAARRIVEQHGGLIPADPVALAQMPGLGRYTAAAVASIAYGAHVAALDGNIKRVLARLTGLAEPIDAVAPAARLWRTADDLLGPPPRRRGGARAGNAGDHNQALMELGATVCLPRGPRCDACPVRRWCAAAEAGHQNEIPQKSRKSAVPHVTRAAAAIVQRGRLLLARRPDTGLLAGMWELPGAQIASPSGAIEALRASLLDQYNLRCAVGEILGEVRHVFTHRTMTVAVYRCRLELRPNARRGRLRWCRPTELARMPIAALDRKTLALTGSGSA